MIASAMLRKGLSQALFLFVALSGGILICCPQIALSQQSPELTSTPASPALQRVRTLIRANVTDLAQQIMEQQGPPMLPGGEWLNWERQLWALYQQRGEWQALYDRVQSIPPAFPTSIRQEAELQSIAALTALGKGAAARHLLRQRLLSARISERDKIPLRKQVIESYLAEGNFVDASLAAKSFHFDYRPQDREWLLLSAQIALGYGDADEVVNILAPLDEPDARLLRIYARLLNASLNPLQVINNVNKFRELNEFSALDKLLTVVLVEAAKRGDQYTEWADQLEQYLLSDAPTDRNLEAIFPSYNAEHLKQAYIAVTHSLFERVGGLVQDQSKWVELALTLPEEDVVERRAVWAYIKLFADDKTTKQIAANNFVRTTIRHERTALAHHVFGGEGFLGALTLSPSIGLDLSNVAVQIGDVELAAEANANVTGPPPGMDYADWLLYTGRISIIAGHYQQGAEQIEKWLGGFEKLTPEQTDSVLQPIFDLQTVNQHRLAIPLLEKVDQQSPGGKYHREVAYWIAESFSATKEHVKAADYFLFSAMQKANGFDQWGESARFRAADALMDGKLFADAKTLFEGLLRRAKEESRIAGLKQKLQQLSLLEASFN